MRSAMLMTGYLSGSVLLSWQLLLLLGFSSISTLGQEKTTPLCPVGAQNTSSTCENALLFNISNFATEATRNMNLEEIEAMRNDSIFKDNVSDCKPIRVVYARGPTEPGNVGVLTGPPFFDALAAYVDNQTQISVQGVDYKADVSEFLAGSSPDGDTKMADLITETQEKCPDTHLIVSGYSQGALIVHGSTDKLPSESVKKIGAVILFGDPKNGTPIQNYDTERTFSTCHIEDRVCGGQLEILPTHLNYSEDAEAAADFAVKTMSHLGISSYGYSPYRPRPYRPRPYRPRPYKPWPYYPWPRFYNTFSDPNDPANGNPNMADPNMNDPINGNPNMADPNMNGPINGNPDMTDPNMTDPNMTDPNMTDPNMNDPINGNPNMADPNMNGPINGNPNMADPNMNGPINGNPDMADPNMNGPINGNPDMADPNMNDPTNGDPNIAKQNVTDSPKK